MERDTRNRTPRTSRTWRDRTIERSSPRTRRTRRTSLRQSDSFTHCYTSGVTLQELRTPCVLVDWPRVERNVERMQAAANAGGLRLRPHAKTHKSPEVARLQLARGAAGICCAKLGEAEVFADAGIEDIRLPYPLHPSNADRVIALLDRTHLSFIVDNIEVARGWSAAMTAAGRDVDVLVRVGGGLLRCGV